MDGVCTGTATVTHVCVISGSGAGEFCGQCGLHWTDPVHTRSMAIAAGAGAAWTR